MCISKNLIKYEVKQFKYSYFVNRPTLILDAEIDIKCGLIV